METQIAQNMLFNLTIFCLTSWQAVGKSFGAKAKLLEKFNII